MMEGPFWGDMPDLKKMQESLELALELVSAHEMRILDLEKRIESMAIEKMAPTGAFIPRNRRFM